MSIVDRSPNPGSNARRLRRPRAAATALFVGLATLLGACSDKGDLNTFRPVGEEAKKIDELHRFIFIAAIVVFVLVEGALIYILVRYRKRKGEGTEALPPQVHGNTKVELLWTIVPAVLLVFVGIFMLSTLFELEERDPDAITVHVESQQWWWSFKYDLDDDGDFEVVTANELWMPTGQQVNLQMTSNDVIHAFWIPRLNGKRDTPPNHTTTLSLESNEEGWFRGQCTEFCGLSHSRMQMWVKVVSPEAFTDWLEAQAEPAEAPTSELAQQGQEVFAANCASCHSVRGLTVKDADGNDVPSGSQVDDLLKSGAAPDLTHLMSRYRFAGAIFELWEDKKVGDPAAFNRHQLEAWIRDPGAEKPMAADDLRGMPDRGLSEDDIDKVVAYLETLK